MPLKGVVIREMKRCGKHACRCSSGALHGPYHYRYYRERGRLRKRYVRPQDVQGTLARIEARRHTLAERRAAQQQLRLLITAMKEMDLWGI